MSILAMLMLLVAGMVMGSGPEKASGEMVQTLDLRGEWEGSWQHAQDFKMRAASGSVTSAAARELVAEMPGGVIVLPINAIADQKNGRLHIAAGKGFLGIYEQNGDRLSICFRPARNGYPISFRGGNGQHLLILRRVQLPK